MDVRRPIEPFHRRPLMVRLPSLRGGRPRRLPFPPRLPLLRRQTLAPLRRRRSALPQLRRDAVVPLPRQFREQVRAEKVFVL